MSATKSLSFLLIASGTIQKTILKQITIEDAEEELGFPRGWTYIENLEGEEMRWKMLRRNQCGCSINHLFHKYLGKMFEQPI
ncbi:MAG: hypothetical protein ACUZ8O_11170 [Candidatus Anammoxibacter sp.]